MTPTRGEKRQSPGEGREHSGNEPEAQAVGSLPGFPLLTDAGARPVLRVFLSFTCHYRRASCHPRWPVPLLLSLAPPGPGGPTTSSVDYVICKPTAALGDAWVWALEWAESRSSTAGRVAKSPVLCELASLHQACGNPYLSPGVSG